MRRHSHLAIVDLWVASGGTENLIAMFTEQRRGSMRCIKAAPFDWIADEAKRAVGGVNDIDHPSRARQVAFQCLL